MKWLYLLLLFTLSSFSTALEDIRRVRTIYEEETIVKKEIKETPFISDKKKRFVEMMWRELHNHTSLDDSTIVTLIAQSAIESRWGNCLLSRFHNNYFGITGFYKRRAVMLPTTEYINGEYVQMPRYFRSYPELKDCIKDRVRIIHVIDGYATAPSYWRLVSSTRELIENSVKDVAYKITIKTNINYGEERGDNNSSNNANTSKPDNMGIDTTYNRGGINYNFIFLQDSKLNIRLNYGEPRESNKYYRFKKYPFARGRKSRLDREFRYIFQREDRGSRIDPNVVYISLTSC